MMKAFAGIGFVVGLALAQQTSVPRAPAHLSNPSTAATKMDIGVVDAGQVYATYAAIGYVDAGQVWSANGNFGFVDAGRLSTGYAEVGYLDAGFIGLRQASSGKAFAATSAQTDTWLENNSTGLGPETVVWGGMWNNPSHAANFFDGIHGYEGTTTNHPFQIRSNNISRITAYANGNVQIGGTTYVDDGWALQVKGGVAATAASINGIDAGTILTTGVDLGSASNTLRWGTNATISAGSNIINLSVGTGASANSWRNSNTAAPNQMVSVQTSGTKEGNTFDTSSAYSGNDVIAAFKNNGTRKTYLSPDGKFFTTTTDSSGSPGSATGNTVCGRSAIANGASTATITNSDVSASSNVFLQLESSAVGIGGLVSVPGSGSFVVTSVNGTGVATNATGTAKFSWCVFN